MPLAEHAGLVGAKVHVVRVAWRLSIALILSACSRTGLDAGSLSLGAAGGPAGASESSDGSTSDGAAPLGRTRRWAAVKTEDDTRAQGLFAIRFGTDRIEQVTRLDPDLPHSIVHTVWAPDATALAFSTMDASDALVVYVADFRLGAPVVSAVDSNPTDWLNVGPWLDGERVMWIAAHGGSTHVNIRDLDGSTTPADPDPNGPQWAQLSLSPNRKTLVAEYQAMDGSVHVRAARVDAGALGPWTPVDDFGKAQTYYGPSAWAPDSSSFAWIAYSVNERNSLGFQPAEIDAFDMTTDVPTRLPSFPFAATDHPNYLEYAPQAHRYFVHSSRVIGTSASIAVGIQDTSSPASGEVQPDGFFGGVVGMSADGNAILFGSYQDRMEVRGASFRDVTDLTASGAVVFLQDDAGKPIRGGQLLTDGSAMLALSGQLLVDFRLQTGPVDWLSFDVEPTLGPPIPIARLSEAATVDAWALSPDESSLVYRTSIGTNAIPESDLLLQRRAASELGVYWVDRRARSPNRLPTKWTAYDSMVWLPDSRSLLRFAPANDPSEVSDVHDQNDQGATLHLDGAYLLEWVQLTAPKVVAVTPLFGAGRSVVPAAVALPDRWDD